MCPGPVVSLCMHCHFQNLLAPLQPQQKPSACWHVPMCCVYIQECALSMLIAVTTSTALGCRLLMQVGSSLLADFAACSKMQRLPLALHLVYGLQTHCRCVGFVSGQQCVSTVDSLINSCRHDCSRWLAALCCWSRCAAPVTCSALVTWFMCVLLPYRVICWAAVTFGESTALMFPGLGVCAAMSCLGLCGSWVVVVQVYG